MKKIYSLLFGCISVLNVQAAVAAGGVFVQPHVMQAAIKEYFVYDENGLWVKTFDDGKFDAPMSKMYNAISVYAIENWNNCIKRDKDALLRPECIVDLCGNVFNIVNALKSRYGKETIANQSANEYCIAFTKKLVAPIQADRGEMSINGTPISQISINWEKNNEEPTLCKNLGPGKGGCQMVDRKQWLIKYENAGKIHENGHMNWRFNNPGNLRSSSLACTNICTYPNSYFAVFATEEEGWQAMYNLLTGNKYGGLTISEAIATYAPRSDNNNPEKYANRVKAAMRAEGVTRDLESTPLKSFTKEEIYIMMKAMVSVEGGAKGKVTTF